MLDRSSASLAALPGEASPTRACLGTIIGHENGEGDEGEMSIPCPGDVIVLSHSSRTQGRRSLIELALDRSRFAEDKVNAQRFLSRICILFDKDDHDLDYG